MDITEAFVLCQLVKNTFYDPVLHIYSPTLTINLIWFQFKMSTGITKPVYNTIQYTKV